MKRSSVRSYNVFKGLVTALLLVIIAVLLLRPPGWLAGPETPANGVPAAGLARPSVHAIKIAMDGQVSLAGGAEPGAALELRQDGRWLASVEVAEDGAWQWSGKLQPGEHLLNLRTLDAAGQTVNESGEVAVVAPQPSRPLATPSIDPPQFDADKGATMLSGTGEPGATVDIEADGRSLAVLTVDAAGKWTWSGQLQPGDHQLVARTVDDQGRIFNRSTPLRISVPEPPKLVAAPVIDPPGPAEDGSVVLSGRGEPGSTLELRAGEALLGAVAVGENGRWRFDGQLEPGDHEITARTVDEAGQPINESAPVVFNVPEPPRPLVPPSLKAPQVAEGGKVLLFGAGEPGSTVEVWANGELLETITVETDGNWQLERQFEPGDYELTAIAVDETGEATEQAAPLVFNVPAAGELAIAPAMSPPAVDGQGLVTLSGSGQPGAAVEIVEDGTVIGQATVQADGGWRFDYQAAPGQHSLAAQNAGDPASLSAAASISVVQPTTGRAYIVQSDDWLSKLALEFYGDIDLYTLIVDGTNAKAAEDPTFLPIDDPDAIEVGQKLWIPPAP